jgi:hypothetical protein
VVWFPLWVASFSICSCTENDEASRCPCNAIAVYTCWLTSGTPPLAVIDICPHMKSKGMLYWKYRKIIRGNSGVKTYNEHVQLFEAEERLIIFNSSARTSNRTLHIIITKTKWLLLFKEMIDVYLHRESYKTRKYKMYGYWLKKPDGTYSSHSPLKG